MTTGYGAKANYNGPRTEQGPTDSPLTINAAIELSHLNAVEKGFYDGAVKGDTHLVVLLALIGCEVSEAIEEVRKGNSDKVEEELADIAIRLFDLAGGYNINLEKAIRTKMAINKDRPRKHGKRF